MTGRPPKDERGGPKKGRPGGRPDEYTPAGGSGDDPLTRNLKLVFGEIAQEPMPENILSLLDQLDDPEDGSEKGPEKGDA